MKLKYILTSLAAVCVLAIGCTKSYPTELSNFKVSQSTIGLKGDVIDSVLVTVNATEEWAFVNQMWINGKDTLVAANPKWISIDKLSGEAGQSTIKFKTVETTKACNSATLKIQCGVSVQYIYVQQGVGSTINTAETAFTTDEAYDFYDGGTNKGAEIFVKGVVKSAKIDVTYGNADFYLECSKGQFELYRCYDIDGANFTDSKKVQVGDVVVATGTMTEYSGVVELGAGCKLVSITKSLVQVCDETVLTNVEKEGGVFGVKLIAKGGNLDIRTADDSDAELDWVGVKSISQIKAVKSSDPDTTLVNVAVAASEVDARSGKVYFTSGTSTVFVSVSQKSGLAAYPVPYTETFATGMGSWTVNDITNPDAVTAWTHSSQYSCVIASGYSGGNHEVVSELVSPLIDLSSATVASLTFDHAYRFGTNKYNELNIAVSKDNGATWTTILIPDYGPADYKFTMTTNSVSLTPYVGNMVNVKFVYKSFATGGPKWEIKNVSVTGEEITVKNIAQLNSLAATSTPVNFTATLDSAIVSYVSGNNAFIQDNTGGIQLYKVGHGLVAGDVLKGTITGKIKLYSGYAELTELNYTSATKSTATFVGDTLSLADINAKALRYQNCLVTTSEDVTLSNNLYWTQSDDKRNGTISSTDGTSLAARLQDKTVSINAGTAKLTAIPCIFNGTVQLGIWSAAHFAVAPPQ